MALTEEQRSLRQVLFPGKRGKLDKNDQKIFEQMCAEKGMPIQVTEGSKPAPRKSVRRYRRRDATTTEEEVEEDLCDDEEELEEVTEPEQDQEPDEELADDLPQTNIKLEPNDADEDEDVPAASVGPAEAAKQRARISTRKRSRPSNLDTAAQALMGLTGLPTPPPAAAAVGRQRIAAALPAVGYKPFAGVPLRLSSRHGGAAGQQCDAPYDYYDVYQSYLTCMDSYSRAVGRLGADAVAAPIPPEELLGPAYASHLSTDRRAPHWTPHTAAAAPAAAAAPPTAPLAAAAADTEDAAAPPGSEVTARGLAAVRRPAAAAAIRGRGRRRSAAADAAVLPAAKRRRRGTARGIDRRFKRNRVPRHTAADSEEDKEEEGDAGDHDAAAGGAAAAAALQDRSSSDKSEHGDDSRSGSPTAAADGAAAAAAVSGAKVGNGTSSGFPAGTAAAAAAPAVVNSALDVAANGVAAGQQNDVEMVSPAGVLARKAAVDGAPSAAQQHVGARGNGSEDTHGHADDADDSSNGGSGGSSRDDEGDVSDEEQQQGAKGLPPDRHVEHGVGQHVVVVDG